MFKIDNERNVEAILESYPIEIDFVKEKQNLLPSFSFPEGFPVKSETHGKAMVTGLYKKVTGALADKGEKEKTEPLKQWSSKKLIRHTFEVARVARDIIKFPAFPSSEDNSKALMISTWVHDVGRQCEIDFANFNTVELGSLRGDKSKDHAFESFNILQKAGVTDPRILIPTRYHGIMRHVEAMESDPLFMNLSKEEKSNVMAITDGLRDADKAANLMSKSQNGMEGVAEMMNPKYRADYDITPGTLKGLINTTGCLTSIESHRLDAMLRWLSWGDQFVYPVPSIAMLINELWNRTFEEAQAEFEASANKDQMRYKNTINSLREARQIQMTRLVPSMGTSIEQEVQTLV